MNQQQVDGVPISTVQSNANAQPNNNVNAVKISVCCNIVSDLTKFNTVVGNIEANLLPSRIYYSQHSCQQSLWNIKTAKLRFLTELTLGNLKPSDLLHKMQDLPYGKVGDYLLKILFYLTTFNQSWLVVPILYKLFQQWLINSLKHPTILPLTVLLNLPKQIAIWLTWYVKSKTKLTLSIRKLICLGRDTETKSPKRSHNIPPYSKKVFGL